MTRLVEQDLETGAAWPASSQGFRPSLRTIRKGESVSSMITLAIPSIENSAAFPILVRRLSSEDPSPAPVHL